MAASFWKDADDLTSLGLGARLVVLCEGRADEGGDHPALGLSGVDPAFPRK